METTCCPSCLPVWRALDTRGRSRHSRGWPSPPCARGLCVTLVHVCRYRAAGLNTNTASTPCPTCPLLPCRSSARLAAYLYASVPRPTASGNKQCVCVCVWYGLFIPHVGSKQCVCVCVCLVRAVHSPCDLFHGAYRPQNFLRFIKDGGSGG